MAEAAEERRGGGRRHIHRRRHAYRATFPRRRAGRGAGERASGLLPVGPAIGRSSEHYTLLLHRMQSYGVGPGERRFTETAKRWRWPYKVSAAAAGTGTVATAVIDSRAGVCRSLYPGPAAGLTRCVLHRPYHLRRRAKGPKARAPAGSTWAQQL
jgi:hypothetical protein